MENAADVHVELVKLVDGLSCAHVPQHAVVEHQVVRGVEGGAVPLVVVGQVRVVQRQRYLTRLDVIDLGRGRRPAFNQTLIVHLAARPGGFKSEMRKHSPYSCYMFFRPDDSILREFAELHVVITQESVPARKKEQHF